MLRIHKIQKFDCPIHVQPGDTFRLLVNDKLVYTRDLKVGSTITHWASFEIGENGIAYAVGNESLEADLRKLESLAA
jgi:hypothetical protein